VLKRTLLIVAVLVAAGLVSAARAVDISGTWTASFDTQIGVQNYTYEFAVKDGVLTGTAKSEMGESKLADGKVDGDNVSFVENVSFQGNDIRIDYKGTISSADEIKFTRQVGEFATEQLVAKRATTK
jgi:hypothetical protein